MAAKKKTEHRACAWGYCSTPAAVWMMNSVGAKIARYCTPHAEATTLTAPATYQWSNEDGTRWHPTKAAVAPQGNGSREQSRPNPSAPPVKAAGPGEGLAGGSPPAGQGPVRREIDSPRDLATVPATRADSGGQGAQLPAQTAALSIFQGAGTLVCDERQTAILMAAAPDAACNIRDDGMVYLVWTEYAKRLSFAFGPGGWAMVPLEKPAMQGSAVYVRYALVIGGCFVSEAMMSHPYYPNNHQQRYDDAVESAKSECLRRCCKALGAALEPWDAAWRERWKKEYAVLVMRSKSSKWAWRRKDAKPFDDERLSRESSESEYTKPARLDDEAKAHIDSIMGEGEWADFTGDGREGPA